MTETSTTTSTTAKPTNVADALADIVDTRTAEVFTGGGRPQVFRVTYVEDQDPHGPAFEVDVAVDGEPAGRFRVTVEKVEVEA